MQQLILSHTYGGRHACSTNATRSSTFSIFFLINFIILILILAFTPICKAAPQDSIPSSSSSSSSRIINSGGSEVECRASQAICTEMVYPYLQNAQYMFPTNLNHVNDMCKMWSRFVDCIRRYISSCFEETRRALFHKSVENSIDTVHAICSSKVYQTEYLNKAQCFKQVSVDYCGQNYQALIDSVSNVNANDEHICCNYAQFRECVNRPLLEECGRKAKNLMDHSMSFLISRCAGYYRHQNYGDECPRPSIPSRPIDSIRNNVNTPNIENPTTIAAAEDDRNVIIANRVMSESGSGSGSGAITNQNHGNNRINTAGIVSFDPAESRDNNNNDDDDDDDAAASGSVENRPQKARNNDRIMAESILPNENIIVHTTSSSSRNIENNNNNNDRSDSIEFSSTTEISKKNFDLQNGGGGDYHLGTNSDDDDDDASDDDAAKSQNGNQNQNQNQNRNDDSNHLFASSSSSSDAEIEAMESKQPEEMIVYTMKPESRIGDYGFDSSIAGRAEIDSFITAISILFALRFWPIFGHFLLI